MQYNHYNLKKLNIVLRSVKPSCSGMSTLIYDQCEVGGGSCLVRVRGFKQLEVGALKGFLTCLSDTKPETESFAKV